jgi:hypothetical protein
VLSAASRGATDESTCTPGSVCLRIRHTAYVITTWRALLNTHPALELGTGCAQHELDQAKKIIGRVPREVASYPRAVNGVFDQSGQWQVGWPLDRIVAERQGPSYGQRQLGHLLAFGDNGTDVIVVRLGPLESVGSLRGEIRVPRSAVRSVEIVRDGLAPRGGWD